MSLKNTALAALAVVFIPGALAGACSATAKPTEFTGGEGGAGAGSGEGGGFDFDAGNGSDGGFVGDPTTCEEAALARTYIGCDFWPTVVGNNVWSIFDFAVVVANAGDQPADVTVMRGADTIATATIQPNDLGKLYLPWVPELKGPDTNSCGSATPMTATVRAPGGAYHLVSSRPVTVYQFNALEYAPQGGPPGKDWSACPGKDCFPIPVACFSYSNDASLLLPSTAMTGNYRITSTTGWATPVVNMGGYFAVTGTEDGTTVQVKVSPTGQILAGGGVPETGPSGLVSFSLGRGEVVEVVMAASADPAGTLVYADKPVQVIAGMPCTQIPHGTNACDHIEESVFPVETLGKHYFVTTPTAPNGGAASHVVRIFGNVDGTKLTYPGTVPDGAPATINAGQTVDLGLVPVDFEIVGDHEFAVGMFMPGAAVLDQAGTGKGDPAQSLSTAVEQYRTKYIFLAPDDYDTSYVDVVQPLGAKLTLDGVEVNPAVQPISSGYGAARLPLGPGKNGAHVLLSTEPVGIQVMGYGSYTSYQYPGGLNLTTIAPPPPPPN